MILDPGFLLAQVLGGMASASALFLVAVGLSIIFGVTRVVNFAHGTLFMFGAYLAYTAAVTWGLGFWPAILVATLGTALIGAVVEIGLLRRIYPAPELFQLVATFALVLIGEELVLMIWGPEDLLGPRAPGLTGAVALLGQRIPSYDLFLIAMGPVVLLLLWALFTKTRWGLLVRAATQDRSMVAALGCDQRLLFTGVFMLGAALAGFGGALQIPREAVHHGLHIQIIVEAFVVVVVGGMGSVPGAYLAALLVGLVQAFGILIFPQGTMVMVVGTMAAVLAVRPMGLLGRLEPGGEHSAVGLGLPLFPSNRLQRTGWAVLLALAGLAPFFLGPYGLTVLSEILVLALFAAALQLVMGPGGLVSFGHAAYFGLGAYGTALAITYLGLSLEAALIFAPLAGGVGGLLCGLVLTRLSGVYFAMLTLAFAEFIHATTFQWVSVTGGDNGMIGLWPSDWVSGPTVVYGVILVLVVPLLWAIRWLVRSPFGAQLRAARDAPDRAAASGIPVVRVQILAFALSGSLAGLAGGLLVFLKGSVFPTYASIPVSVDALVMVLLGGVHALAGPLLGAASYTLLEILVSAQTDHWRLVVGLVILALVLLFPGGLTSAVGQAGQRLFGLLKSQQRPDAAS